MKKLFLLPLLAIALLPGAANLFNQEVYTYCLRQFQWVSSTVPNEMRWEVPGMANVAGLIDLRTVAQTATPGPLQQGQAIIAYEVAPVELFPGDLGCFGGKINEPIHPVEGWVFDSLTKQELGTFPAGITLGDAVFELLTTYSDPTGLTAPKPIGMGADGKLKVYLGGKTPIKEESFVLGVHPHSDKLVARLQEDYRKVRAETLAGYYAPNKHLQYLDYLTEQYHTDDWRQFVPLDLPYEQPIQHATTITEDWDTCGPTTAPDLDCDLTWTHFTPDSGSGWFINASDDADCEPNESNNYYARADSSLSTDEHSTQIDAVNLGGTGRQAGIFTRKAAGDTAVTLYRTDGTHTTAELSLYNAGVPTLLDDDTAQDWNEPEEWRLESDGSDNHEVFEDETSILGPSTNSTVTGNLRTGIWCFSNNASHVMELDNFVAADLAVAARRTFTFWPF